MNTIMLLVQDSITLCIALSNLDFIGVNNNWLLGAQTLAHAAQNVIEYEHSLHNLRDLCTRIADNSNITDKLFLYGWFRRR